MVTIATGENTSEQEVSSQLGLDGMTPADALTVSAAHAYKRGHVGATVLDLVSGLLIDSYITPKTGETTQQARDRLSRTTVPEHTPTATAEPRLTATNTPTPTPTAKAASRQRKSIEATATNTQTPLPTATTKPRPAVTNTPMPLQTAKAASRQPESVEPTATETPTPPPPPEAKVASHQRENAEPTATATTKPRPVATNTPTPLPTATTKPRPVATSTPTPEPVLELHISTDEYTPVPREDPEDILRELGCIDDEGNIIEGACPWLEEDD